MALIKRLLHYVSQLQQRTEEKQTKMILSEFINRVLVVDDKPEEVAGLLNVLSKEDILCESYEPEDLEMVQLSKNRELIVVDLFLNVIDSSAGAKGQISYIRHLLKKVIGKKYGAYGLVLWTSHPEYVDELKEALSKDREQDTYETPMFIVDMKKADYLQRGFDTFLADLQTKVNNDPAALFFMTWTNSVNEAKEKAIKGIYAHAQNYQTQKDDLLNILYLLACNYTGIPSKSIKGWYSNVLFKDAYKTFDEMMFYDLIHSQSSNGTNFLEGYEFAEPKDLVEKLKLYSFINTKLFVDTTNLFQNEVVPGNVYVIKDTSIYAEYPEARRKGREYIMIELTPPCDYSHKKVFSRCVIGAMFDCPTEEKSIADINKSMSAQNRYSLWPIEINRTLKYVMFDFRYFVHAGDELKDANKMKLIFRMQNRVFADILQKFSSHSARLGTNMLYPEIKESEEKNDARRN